MAGFDNEVLYCVGERLQASSAQAIFLMQKLASDVSRINHVGDPEGVVAANPSSISHDPVSGFFYLKVSGTGTTLWKRILPDGSVVDSFQVDTNTAPGTNPVLPDANGLVTITGGQVATGTIGTNVIRTDSVAANTYTVEIQRSTMAATPGALANNGVSHFDSQDFSVSALGFVTLPTLKVSYTPVLSFNGGTTGITYTTRNGEYMRIGNLVLFNLSILLSNKGSSVGDAQITLPFTNISGTRAVVDVINTPLPGANTYVVASVESGKNYIKIGSYPNLANLANTNFTNTSRVDCSGFFFLN